MVDPLGQIGIDELYSFTLHELVIPHFLPFMLHIVLIEPEIPQNTGNIARLCVATGSRLHLVGPRGFSIDDKGVRRAGMDYWQLLDLKIWASFIDLQQKNPRGRFFYLSSKVKRPYWDASFQDGDFLIFGRETKGLPGSLLSMNADSVLTIPMTTGTRSLNLATSAGIVLYEAIRQLGQIPLAGEGDS